MVGYVLFLFVSFYFSLVVKYSTVTVYFVIRKILMIIIFVLYQLLH